MFCRLFFNPPLFQIQVSCFLLSSVSTTISTSLPLEGMRLNVCVSGGFTCSHGAVTELTLTTPPPTTVFTYTFETPNFTLGQTTPLLNVAPNIGDATFRTSFAAATDPAGYH